MLESAVTQLPANPWVRRSCTLARTGIVENIVCTVNCTFLQFLHSRRSDLHDFLLVNPRQIQYRYHISRRRFQQWMPSQVSYN